MILRRLTEHIREQNWFAVGIDFVIVVIGVFVGIQVSNWNDERSLHDHETALLIELKRELESSIHFTDAQRVSFMQARDAGLRSLDFIESGQQCTDHCWRVLVDFYHASQWQAIDLNPSTYEDMRRQNLPRSRTVIDAVEIYLAHNKSISRPLAALPAYRDRVRQLIPARAQQYYWQTCVELEAGSETYSLDCPAGPFETAAADAVEAIRTDPDIKPQLTQWIGHIVSTPPDLEEQNETALAAVAAVEEELMLRR
ncbi:MAG: hypothetical protein AAGI89_11405 [Pseudomonadota bacterium]